MFLLLLYLFQEDCFSIILLEFIENSILESKKKKCKKIPMQTSIDVCLAKLEYPHLLNGIGDDWVVQILHSLTKVFLGDTFFHRSGFCS